MAILKNELFLENFKPNVYTKGHVLFQSSEDFRIKDISGAIYIETRGKTSTRNNQIGKITIDNPGVIYKNELKMISFSFKLPENHISSYSGKNVNLKYKCEIRIAPRESDVQVLDQNLFEKVKSYVTSDYSVKCKAYFDVDKPKGKYQVIERKSIFKLEMNFVIIGLSILIMGLAYLMLIPELNPISIFIGLVLSGVLTYAMKTYAEKIWGPVTFKNINDQDSFICQVRKSRKFNLKNQEIYYEIKERVVDDRGTSSSVYISELFTSKRIKISDNSGSKNISFDYPQMQGLESLQHHNTSIIWDMHLKGKFLGISFIYAQEFVKKITASY